LADNILKSFVRRFFFQTKQVNLIETLELALKIIDSSYKSHNVDIIKNFTPEPLLRTMIPGELSQVVMNVMANAKDELIKQEKEAKWIKITATKNNNKAIITIEDNAGGIPDNVLPNIFKQYFTTKDKDSGTGLGLYMSKGLIENNLSGELNVENTKNGALFTIKIPLDNEGLLSA